jgi:hypothetical protein
MKADLPMSGLRTVSRLGFWLAIILSIITLASLALGITTPPRSGPFCQGDCITYPYTDAAEFVPRDYLWMYPAILIGPVFLIVLICVHQLTASDRKIFSQIAISFTILSATILIIDYAIQLVVIQPSFVKGETESLTLFSQYNPHGIFIALEDLGYLMMSFAFLFISFAFSFEKKGERALKKILLLSALLGFFSLLVLSVIYGFDLEYLFECAIILINWMTLIVVGILLSIYFIKVKNE